MSSMAMQWFEICVVDYRRNAKTNNKVNTFVPPGVSDLVFNDQYGLTHVPPKNKAKIDKKPKLPVRTIFRQAKDNARAMKIGKRIGAVIYCQKVNTSYHYKKIEYLNLKQLPMTVTLDKEDEFVLNAQGELSPTLKATRSELELKYEINVVD